MKVTGSAPADPDADGEVYDPASKRVFTMNGDSKSSTVVDAATGKVVGKIDLGGEPEFPVADGRGHVYANIESTSELIEIDSGTLKILHRWPLAPGEHPSGLAMDSGHHILFSGCRNKLMAWSTPTLAKCSRRYRSDRAWTQRGSIREPDMRSAQVATEP